MNEFLLSCFPLFNCLLIVDIGFIYAIENCTILNEWLEKIINNVKIYKDIIKEKNNSNSWKKEYEKGQAYDYLGNGIIDPILKNITNKKFLQISVEKMKTFPEREYFEGNKLNNTEKYRFFYFQKGDPVKVTKQAKYLLLLHNSWTPEKYKNMSEKEFLNQDILLSKLLINILKR